MRQCRVLRNRTGSVLRVMRRAGMDITRVFLVLRHQTENAQNVEMRAISMVLHYMNPQRALPLVIGCAQIAVWDVLSYSIKQSRAPAVPIGCVLTVPCVSQKHMRRSGVRFMKTPSVAIAESVVSPDFTLRNQNVLLSQTGSVPSVPKTVTGKVFIVRVSAL